MLVFAVIVQSFAVIGQQNDDGAMVKAFRFQKREELSDDRVGRGNLAVVCVRVAAAKWFGRIVRHVRLVDVKEKEEWLLRMCANPFLRPFLGDHSGTLKVGEERAWIRLDRCVVIVERRCHTGFCAQHE